MIDKKALKAMAYALDPVRHFDVLGLQTDLWQREVLRRVPPYKVEPKAPRNIICCTSRQVGKSTVISVKAANKACYTPKSLVIVTAPVERQSKELFKKIMECVKLTPGAPKIVRDSATEMEFANGSRVVCLPGKAEFIAGFSAPAMVIIDEACYAKDNLFYTVKPMLAVSKGELILISTPFVCQGFFYKTWTEDDPDWRKFEVKAFDVGRLDAEFLAKERRKMGDWWFNSQYMCKFQQPEDSVCTEEMINNIFSDNEYVSLIKSGDDPLCTNSEFTAMAIV